MIHIPKTKIWEACGDKSQIPALQDPMFYPNVTVTSNGEVYHEEGKGTLLAADGFKAVLLHVSHDPEDLEGFVPVDALKAAHKANKLDTLYIDASQPDYVTVGFSGLSQMFRREYFDGSGNLQPRTAIDIKHMSEVIKGRLAGSPETVTVRLNFEYLNQIREGLQDYTKGNRRNGAYFYLTVRTDQSQMHKPVLIEPGPSMLGFAVQMPMHERG